MRTDGQLSLLRSVPLLTDSLRIDCRPFGAVLQTTAAQSVAASGSALNSHNSFAELSRHSHY